MNATTFMLDQEASRHKSSLQRWVLDIRNARDPVTAFTRARNKPSRSGLLAGMAHLVSSDNARAIGQAEAVLEAMIKPDLPIDTLRRMQDLTRGHFPRLWHAIGRVIADAIGAQEQKKQAPTIVEILAALEAERLRLQAMPFSEEWKPASEAYMRAASKHLPLLIAFSQSLPGAFEKFSADEKWTD